jgi:hypothetical protein
LELVEKSPFRLFLRRRDGVESSGIVEPVFDWHSPLGDQRYLVARASALIYKTDGIRARP